MTKSFTLNTFRTEDTPPNSKLISQLQTVFMKEQILKRLYFTTEGKTLEQIAVADYAKYANVSHT